MKSIILAIIPTITMAVDSTPIHERNFDLRFILSTISSIDSDEVKSGPLSGSDEYTSGHGSRVGIEWIYNEKTPSNVGFFVGFGLYSQKNTGSESEAGISIESTLNSVVFGPQIGVLISPNKNYQLDIGVRAAYGPCDSKTTASNGYISIDLGKSTDGFYSGYDIFLGNRFTFNSGFQLGLDLGINTFTAWTSGTITGTTGETVVDWKGTSPTIGISAGFRW